MGNLAIQFGGLFGRAIASSLVRRVLKSTTSPFFSYNSASSLGRSTASEFVGPCTGLAHHLVSSVGHVLLGGKVQAGAFFGVANTSSKAKSLPQVALDRTMASEFMGIGTIPWAYSAMDTFPVFGQSLRRP